MNRPVLAITSSGISSLACVAASIVGLTQGPGEHTTWIIAFYISAAIMAVWTYSAAGAIIWIDEQRINIRMASSQLRLEDHAQQQFWSSISHDLRTPLNAVLGYTELLIEETPEGTPAIFRNDLERVKAAGFELLTLVNDLLAIADIRSGHNAPHLESTNIDRLINKIETVLAPTAEQLNNRLVFTRPDDNFPVRTDAVRLERILIALGTNAVKFTAEGKVEIVVSRDADTRQLTCRVIDTGRGIDPRDLTAIFQPFAELHDRGKNSGIGLAMCKHLVEEMGGSISVDSVLGKGSTFTVCLPFEEVNRQLEGEDGNAPATNLRRVLIIDENEDTADLLSRQLKRSGCKVMLSLDGAFGLDVAINLQPEIIIIDVDLKSIDGWAALTRLNQDVRTRDIPVVVCSDHDERSRAHSLGIDTCLIKPVTGATVLHGIQRAIQRGTAAVQQQPPISASPRGS